MEMWNLEKNTLFAGTFFKVTVDAARMPALFRVVYLAVGLGISRMRRFLQRTCTK
jgi:hypothetical protein